MMTSSNENLFRVTGPLCGEFTGPGEFPTQRPVTLDSDVFFDLCLNSGWVNNLEAGDLRRPRAHYDVIVMIFGEVAPTIVSIHVFYKDSDEVHTVNLISIYILDIWINVNKQYHQLSNIRRTSVGNKIVDHSGVVALGKDNCMRRRETFKFGDLVGLILEILPYVSDSYMMS